MAKEYISREAALSAQNKSMNLAECRKRLERLPAADVVAVVRCCECAYHDDESQYHYCRKWRRNCPDDSDFFCKWGERKDGGQDDARKNEAP